jgi:hypothetical protein
MVTFHATRRTSDNDGMSQRRSSFFFFFFFFFSFSLFPRNGGGGRSEGEGKGEGCEDAEAGKRPPRQVRRVIRNTRRYVFIVSRNALSRGGGIIPTCSSKSLIALFLCVHIDGGR